MLHEENSLETILIVDKPFSVTCETKMSNIFGFPPLKCEDLLFSLSFIIANEKPLGFSLPVGQKKPGAE